VLRFLVPPSWPDGSYDAHVTVVHGDGRTEERTSPIRVDTTPAAIAVLSATASARPGGAVRLLLKPALAASRLPALVREAGGLGNALKGAMEVKEVLVRAPWGEVVRARMEGPLGAWAAVLHVPDGAAPGTASLEVVASDAAGNVSRRGLDVEILSPFAPRALQASLLGALLVAGPIALLLLGIVALLRRRRGPRPLSQLLIAGSLKDMQEAHPYRRGVER
jgi:hypothetical protein